MNETIERAQAYVTATARVLEQRRFDLLFGTGGDKAAIRAALEAYKTADGGYGYALEPDGRGPTSQPPHIWTALEVLEEIGEADPGLGDHLLELSAPDGGLPVALPSLEPYPRAPWWRLGTEGTLLATAIVYARLPGDHAWTERAEAFCWKAVDGLETTHPYEAEAAITFLDAAPDRARAEAAAERIGTLVRDQGLVDRQPEGYSAGEIHRPHDFAATPDSLARRWFSDDEIEASLDHLAAQQGDDGGWPVTWAIWTPAIEIEWSGLVTIAALKTLRSYQRI
jgi:hypothetical protein